MASRASVATLAIFASRGGCKNACWGASPNPALWDKLSRSCGERANAGTRRRNGAGSLFGENG